MDQPFIISTEIKKKKTLKKLKEKIQTIRQRLKTSRQYNRENFSLKDSKQVFNEIYRSNYWSCEESYSGGGSTVAATVWIRKGLEKVFKRYSIHSMLDIPCGDYNWMRLVKKDGIRYIGADIVSDLVAANNQKYATASIQFQVLDLTSDPLPKVDLIFCKDCLQHLSYENVHRAIDNIKLSGSRWLLTTSYPFTWRNWDIFDGDYRPLNLRLKPFSFPRPVLSIREHSTEVGVEPDKTMYLWRIDQL